MLRFKDNRYLFLQKKAFQKIVSTEHPELTKDSEAFTKIGITQDRLKRYLSSPDDEISVELRTALNLCNYLDVPPCAIFDTDGSLAHGGAIITSEDELKISDPEPRLHGHLATPSRENSHTVTEQSHSLNFPL